MPGESNLWTLVLGHGLRVQSILIGKARWRCRETDDGVVPPSGSREMDAVTQLTGSVYQIPSFLPSFLSSTFFLSLLLNTGSHYVALVGLGLSMASNSKRSACLCLQSAGIKGQCHPAWLTLSLTFRFDIPTSITLIMLIPSQTCPEANPT